MEIYIVYEGNAYVLGNEPTSCTLDNWLGDWVFCEAKSAAVAIEMATAIDYSQHPEYHASRYLFKKLQTFQENRLRLIRKEEQSENTYTAADITRELTHLNSYCIQDNHHLNLAKVRQWIVENHLRRARNNIPNCLPYWKTASATPG